MSGSEIRMGHAKSIRLRHRTTDMTRGAGLRSANAHQVQEMEVRLWSETSAPHSSASHWWSAGTVDFLSHFTGHGFEKRKLFCNLVLLSFFPLAPGPAMQRLSLWVQTRQETPASRVTVRSGNPEYHSRLFGHKLFFSCCNSGDFPKGVNKPLWGELHLPT